jgi:UDP-N-acetylglucosamine 2-epimerase
MKIVTVVGARPQFIKAGAVSRAVQAFNRNCARSERIREILVHTGQHYDYLMDRVFFEELELPKPDYHLGAGSGSHGKQTAAMLEGIEAVLKKEEPGMVLVYGDTNSTLAGALAAAKLGVPVAHVEAGLRSYNRVMAEEINRLVTDHLSSVLFCPTRQAVENLSAEGIRDGRSQVVRNVGDVMYDSVLFYSKLAEKKSTILRDLNLLNPQSAIRNRQYYLATLHRAENTDHPERLKSILKALNRIGKKVPVVFPLHPRTKKMMEAHRLHPDHRKVQWTEPVSYLNMLILEKNATAILTDSGGVQKEAYWFGVPCFTLRDETEWEETLRGGWNVLVGTRTERVLEAVDGMRTRKPSERNARLFGDGKAAGKIVRILAMKVESFT